MRSSTRFVRSMFISIFVILVSIANYSRLTGTENVRAIHIVTLLTCGMGIGIFLVTLFAWIRNRNNRL